MIRPRRIASYLGALAALWLAAMVVTGVALEGRTRRRVAERIADSLHAEAAIESGNLSLVRGRLDLAALTVRRDDLIGHLAIAVPAMECELLPLGGALFDRDCRALAVRGARFEVSAAALFRLKRPKRPPLRAQHVVIDDARLEFAPSAFMPNLGRVVIAVEHAEAGPTVFKTPLSWIFALRALAATVELPAGITLRLAYAQGELRVAGGLFGATPVALPIALPIADLADDPRAEIAKLLQLGKDLAEQVVTRKAEDWLKSTLP